MLAAPNISPPLEKRIIRYCKGLPTPNNPAVPITINTTESHGTGEKKNINNNVKTIHDCTMAATSPARKRSAKRPPSRLPITIPKPAITINQVRLSVEKPEMFVKSGFI